MAEPSIIAVYDTMAKVEEAVYALDRGGLPLTQISSVAQDLQSEKGVHGYATVENMAQKGVITGAWAGGTAWLTDGRGVHVDAWVRPAYRGRAIGVGALGVAGGIEGIVVGMAWGGVR